MVLTVDQTDLDWLLAKCNEHKIADPPHKGMRILLNYARDEDKNVIFGNKTLITLDHPVQYEFEIYQHQGELLSSLVGHFEAKSKDELIQRLFRQAKTERDQLVFLKIRCNDPVCSHTH